MLDTYIQQVQRLLHNVTGTLYGTGDITVAVNEARKQVAMEGQCIRQRPSYTLTSGTNNFPLNSFTFAPSSGIEEPLTARSILASGTWLQPRNWEWFTIYCLTNPTATGATNTWSQFGDGITATLFVWPTPTVNLSLSVDVACLPVDLVDNTTPEAIPYPYQRAIKYYACYHMFMDVMRNQDADRMRTVFAKTMQEVRLMSRPTVLPGNSNTDWSPLDLQQGGGQQGA